MSTTRIIKEINYFEFKELISNYKIKVNSHAYFRLNEMQRKIYKDDVLIDILTKEKPTLIGIQQNKNYAIFFARKEGYLRIIFNINLSNIEIITFYIIDHIPKWN